ncbi:MAG: HPr(Ser) kinase/phosphatase, partial [Acidobacteriota bacterium]
ELAETVELTVLAGREGLSNRLRAWRIQKLGLVLQGHVEQVHTGRIQIIGSTEIGYCRSISEAQLREHLEEACRAGVTAFLITKGLPPPAGLLEVADTHSVPVLRSGVSSSETVGAVQDHLEDRLAPRLRVHGVQLDVSGLGVLLLGESGIGKSECALDLVSRGHRLVADDLVEVRRLHSALVAVGPKELRHHMELRGIGIINIKDLFGVSALCERKEVELVLRLVRWKAGAEYERLGVDDREEDLLERKVPYVELPVRPGRNLALLVEVAARNQLLRREGYHPARALVDRLDQDVAAAGQRARNEDG